MFDWAIGSCNEVETQLKMVLKLGYVEASKYEKIRNEVIEIRKMLFGVIKFLEKEREVGEGKKKKKGVDLKRYFGGCCYGFE